MHISPFYKFSYTVSFAFLTIAAIISCSVTLAGLLGNCNPGLPGFIPTTCDTYFLFKPFLTFGAVFFVALAWLWYLSHGAVPILLIILLCIAFHQVYKETPSRAKLLGLLAVAPVVLISAFLLF